MSVRSFPLAVSLLASLFTQAFAQLPASPAGPSSKESTAKSHRITRVYQVADLIIPLEEGTAKATLENQLIRLIESTIRPESWSSMGGWATIDYYPLGMALVVSQTPDAQEQIMELLTALRRVQDVEVAIELCVATVSDAVFERLTRDYPMGPHKGELDGSALSVAFLNDAQVARFLETAFGDPHTNVLQAPKLTVFNGQASTIDLNEKQWFVTGITSTTAADGQVMLIPRSEALATGWKWSLQPAVSADRKYVQLKLTANQTNVAKPVPQSPITTYVTPVYENGAQGQPVPFTQYIQQPKLTHHDLRTTLSIPDGGTALLSGWTVQRQVLNDCGPPILSDVPYVNRLFKNVGYGQETEHVLVLVTPRIIVAAEEELVPPPAVLGSGIGASTGALIGASVGHAEPQEAVPAPQKEAGVTTTMKVAKLLEKYHQACAEGRLEDAKKCARRALALDPACFAKEGHER